MFERYAQLSKVAGIGIVIAADGEIRVNACGITVEKGRLDFDRKVTDLDRVEQLARHFPPGTLVALNITGKGVLLKQADNTAEINEGNFSAILPNAAIDDFYIQHFVSGERSFISLIRKTEAEKWIKRLETLELLPLMLSLGPFPVNTVITQLNVYDPELLFDGHSFTRDDQSCWTTYKYDVAAVSPFPLKVESETISEKLLIPYAAAFQLALQPRVATVMAEVPRLGHKLADIISNKKIEATGALILAGLFVLLLTNFIVFSWLTSENTLLSAKANLSASSSRRMEQLSEKIKQDEGTLNQLGWDGGIRKSVLLDQLASILPASVQWTSIQVNPPDLTEKDQKGPVFIERKIYVTGTTNRILDLNEWIALVKTSHRVNKVQLKTYKYNDELNTGEFFVIIDF